MGSYHPTVTKIIELLDVHQCTYTCFEHVPVRTSEEASALRPEYTLGQGAKALIIRVKVKGLPSEEEKQFVQIVVPGDCTFDAKKVKRLLNAKDIRFATPEEVSEITGGIQPGGVPPFGNLFGVKVYVEKTLLENTEIIFNAGDRRYSIAMNTIEYKKVVEPIICDVV